MSISVWITSWGLTLIIINWPWVDLRRRLVVSYRPHFRSAIESSAPLGDSFRILSGFFQDSSGFFQDFDRLVVLVWSYCGGFSGGFRESRRLLLWRILKESRKESQRIPPKRKQATAAPPPGHYPGDIRHFVVYHLATICSINTN